MHRDRSGSESFIFFPTSYVVNLMQKPAKIFYFVNCIHVACGAFVG